MYAYILLSNISKGSQILLFCLQCKRKGHSSLISARLINDHDIASSSTYRNSVFESQAKVSHLNSTNFSFLTAEMFTKG